MLQTAIIKRFVSRAGWCCCGVRLKSGSQPALSDLGHRIHQEAVDEVRPRPIGRQRCPSGSVKLNVASAAVSASKRASDLESSMKSPRSDPMCSSLSNNNQFVSPHSFPLPVHAVSGRTCHPSMWQKKQSSATLIAGSAMRRLRRRTNQGVPNRSPRNLSMSRAVTDEPNPKIDNQGVFGTHGPRSHPPRYRSTRPRRPTDSYRPTEALAKQQFKQSLLTAPPAPLLQEGAPQGVGRLSASSVASSTWRSCAVCQRAASDSHVAR